MSIQHIINLQSYITELIAKININYDIESQQIMFNPLFGDTSVNEPSLYGNMDPTTPHPTYYSIPTNELPLYGTADNPHYVSSTTYGMANNRKNPTYTSFGIPPTNSNPNYSHLRLYDPPPTPHNP